MNVQSQKDFRTAERRLPFESIALVLQGGGALGAYQAGVYEALAEAGIHPDWVAGVSIGAINSAIIAGNEPAERVAKLRAFWREITANPLLDWAAAADALTPKGDLPRALFNQFSAPARSSPVPRLFQPAAARSLAAPGRLPRRHELLRDQPSEEHSGAACGLRPDQRRRHALQCRRRERTHGQFSSTSTMKHIRSGPST